MGRIFEERVKKSIQAMGMGLKADGIQDTVIIESMLTQTKMNAVVAGVYNNYKDYESQVAETYKKYNGNSDWGNQQTRAIVDFRTAFIAGEGLSVAAKNEQTAAWLHRFMQMNNLNGSMFINAVKATEMAGQIIYLLKVNKKELDSDIEIKVARKPYLTSEPFMPFFTSYGDVFSVQFRTKDELNSYTKIMLLKDAVPVVTGGDDILAYGPTTKVGLVLNDIENYDRATKDIRRLNHILARITPKIKTNDQKETNAILGGLTQLRWKIGDMYVGTGEFDYATPGTGAHDNLKTELTTAIKNISAITGIPVHWLGYVDLMSNRATAESLYEVVKNTTVNERTIHSEAIYKMFIEAQKLYIDNGGSKLSQVDYDIEVKIPLLDFASFAERIKALSVAFADGVISKLDYQNNIPGIDPLETNKQLFEEQKEEINKYTIPEEEENGAVSE